ncbi:protein phosphatase 2C domain-containing protein [Streptomyces sp. BI20]|uniref:protein phosphatase 2C domain-containing protein n=1 Tax=Streptomyces sp. BI20 TaxID=3403460 RepID=UPI003C77ADDD
MQQPAGCPSCAEPLEEGDRFCGNCGLPVPDPAAPTPTPARAAVSTPAAGVPTAAAPGWGPTSSPAPTLVDPTPGTDPYGSGAYGPDAYGSGPDAYGSGPHGGGPYGEPPRGRTSYGDGPGPGYGEPTGPVSRPLDPYRGDAWGAGEPAGHGRGCDGPHPTGPNPVPGMEPAAGHPAPEPGPTGGHEGTGEGAGDADDDGYHLAPARPGGTDSGPERPADPTTGGPGSVPWPTRDDAPVTAPPAAAPAAPAPAPQAPAPAPGKTCTACHAGRVDTDGYCENCGHAQPRERDHVEEALGTVAAVSDRGLRHHRNEDSFAISATAMPDGTTATIAIVCDGVSSASRPDEASAAAASTAGELLTDALPRGARARDAMHEAILAAAEAVNALAPEVPGAQNSPACTLVGAVVAQGTLIVGWVGDSRAYWVPDDRSIPPARLTQDDSWAAQMVAAGLMEEAEAYADSRAHAITGWLGADAYELEPHTAAYRPDRPGVVVVCTDGLWNYAESADDMAAVLPADAASRPVESARFLVEHALAGGGHDNVTVAVVPVPVAPAAAPDPAGGPAD